MLRKSVNDVKLRAAATKERRESPRKTYSGIKSKVAGNLRSQRKAKRMSTLVSEQKAIHDQVVAGNTEVLLRRSSVAKSNQRYEASPQRQAEIDRKVSEINGLKDQIEQRRNTYAFTASPYQPDAFTQLTVGEQQTS